ncbi:MAG: biopolymer transporter ExbD [Bacteroidales bacterium]|nr:biopolymer transporter ExbD [Bacteroidales bacterium]
MARRGTPEVNSGSMADIAFLMLIFFLVTTTMDVDTGIARRLPPMPEAKTENVSVDINKRNICIVLINAQDVIFFRGAPIALENLKESAIEFIKNELNDPALPEKEMTHVKELNKEVAVPKGVISLQNDRGTSYGTYIAVQNELVAAYNEIRDQEAFKHFGVRRFDDLTESQQEGIRTIYPQRISEAEPKNIGGN